MADKSKSKKVKGKKGKKSPVSGNATWTFTKDTPHRAPVLCYIAGIECPITSAQISYGVWQIPQATITLFPDVTMQRLGAEDRVPVALFYLDEYYDPQNPRWCLIFDGEITGWGYTNTSTGRALEFTCIADISIYTKLNFEYITGLSNAAQSTIQTGPQSAETLSPVMVIFPYQLFRRGLLEDSSTPEWVNRPFDLVYNAVRALIGDKMPKALRSVPAINFYNRWIRKQQFQNRWVATPFFDDPSSIGGLFPLLKAAQDSKSLDALATFTSQEGAAHPIFTWIKHVFDTIAMELVMLPTPAVVETKIDGTIVGVPTSSTIVPVNNKNATCVMPKVNANAAAPAKDDFYVAPPEPTKKEEPKKAEPTTKQAAAKQTSDPNIKAQAEQKAAAATAVPQSAKNPMRLTNYFVKPLCYYALPPACNVVFPSMWDRFTYQENYLEQPTRVYFEDNALLDAFNKTNSQPPTIESTYSRTTMARAYPPEADWKYQDTVQRNLSLSYHNFLIWPEEFFKGPFTKKYQAPKWLMQLSQIGANRGPIKKPSPPADDPKAVVRPPDIYSLYAQYEYYRDRGFNRGGMVSGGFNPYLVPGFPVMIFDDDTSQMHTLGYLMNVAQTFTSSQVNTTLNYTQGRTLYEVLNDAAIQMNNPPPGQQAGVAVAITPLEPIDEVRNVLQHYQAADQFYNALLYQKREQKGFPTVFKYSDIVAYKTDKVKKDKTGKETTETEAIVIEGMNEQYIKDKRTQYAAARNVLDKYVGSPVETLIKEGKEVPKEQWKPYADALRTVFPDDEPTTDFLNNEYEGDAASAFTPYKMTMTTLKQREQIVNNPKVEHNLSGTREFTPTAQAQSFFESYDAALQYASRPVCTLEDYIQVIGGTREGPTDGVAFKNSGNAIPTARYYTRIIRYLNNYQGFKPSLQEQGLDPKAAPVATANEFPQMRSNWDSILLNYRERIYSSIKISK